MEFIKIAYLVTVPLLILFSWFGSRMLKRYSTNFLAVSNILLIINSFFVARQLAAFYRLIRSLYKERLPNIAHEKWLFIQMTALVVLPLFSLHPYFRKNTVFSVCLLWLLYSVFPFSTWNTYDLVYKIPVYLCLLCAGYALLWLLNQLPYQSRVV